MDFLSPAVPRDQWEGGKRHPRHTSVSSGRLRQRPHDLPNLV